MNPSAFSAGTTLLLLSQSECYYVEFAHFSRCRVILYQPQVKGIRWQHIW